LASELNSVVATSETLSAQSGASSFLSCTSSLPLINAAMEVNANLLEDSRYFTWSSKQAEDLPSGHPRHEISPPSRWRAAELFG